MLISTDMFLQSKTKVSLGLASGEASLWLGWQVFPLILVMSMGSVSDFFLTIQIPALMSSLIRIPCSEGPVLVSRWIRAHL